MCSCQISYMLNARGRPRPHGRLSGDGELEKWADGATCTAQTAGPVAMDRAGSVMDSFTALPKDDGSGEIGAQMPRALLETVGGGSWSTIQPRACPGPGGIASGLGAGTGTNRR